MPSGASNGGGAATQPYRRWLKLWLHYGGNPDAPEAMHAKQRIADIEGEQAERRAYGL